MSKKSIDVFADKQYITQIGKEIMHFKFADGSQDSKVVSRKEIALVLPWLQSEMNFYDRMSCEMREEAEKQRKAFESCYHFYTEEEMEEAEKRQHLSSISMKVDNDNYIREMWRINGMYNHRWSALYDKYYKLYTQARNSVRGV